VAQHHWIPVVASRLRPQENSKEGTFALNWLLAVVLGCNDFTNVIKTANAYSYGLVQRRTSDYFPVLDCFGNNPNQLAQSFPFPSTLILVPLSDSYVC
jgi:hypothetical protein